MPDGFASPGFADSGWGAAAEPATYGGGPWSGDVRPPKRTPRPAPLLRREFEVGKRVRDATLYLAAGGYANVSLNGRPGSPTTTAPSSTPPST